MLLLFSDRCNESEYIRREVTVAGEVGKVIIPYRIEEARPKGALRVRLSDLHWIDAFEAPDRAFDELICTMLPDGERSETCFPSQLTTSTEAVPAQEVAPAAQTETERIDAEMRYVDMDVTSDSAAEEAPFFRSPAVKPKRQRSLDKQTGNGDTMPSRPPWGAVTSPPSVPLVSQVSPAHVSANRTVERIEQLRRRRDPPTGRYLARPARAAARRVLSLRVLLEWLRRRPIHAAGIVSVIALSVLTPVGIYLTAVPQIVTERQSALVRITDWRPVASAPSPEADARAVVEASADQEDEAVPYTPRAVKTVRSVNLSRQEINGASAPAPSESGGFKLAAAGLAMTKVSGASVAPWPLADRKESEPLPNALAYAAQPPPIAAARPLPMGSGTPRAATAASGETTVAVKRSDDSPAAGAPAASGSSERGADGSPGPIRKPAFLAKLFGGGEEAHEETVAAPAPTRTAAVKSVRGGWMIQVGAYPAEHDAKQRLDAVQSKASKLLGSAHPFTDTVDKGGTNYYRARFAGLDQDKAEAACKYLKLDGVDCIMIKFGSQ